MMVDARIHVHTSGESALAVNSYLVETANGVVVVDAQLTISEATAFRAELEALHKPLLAVLVTHPHGDHVAGITELLRSDHGTSDVPIIALSSVAAVMRETEDEKRAQWEPVFGDEWVARWTFPTKHLSDGESVTFDGLDYRIHDLGAGGDAFANALWVLERGPSVAFTGDLFFNGTHSYVADGGMLAWLVSLRQAGDILAGVETLYPGHGPAGAIDRLDAQRDYLLAYCAAVTELSGGRPMLTDAARQALEARMVSYLPDAPLVFMISLGADAVAAELADGRSVSR